MEVTHLGGALALALAVLLALFAYGYIAAQGWTGNQGIG